MVEQVERGEVDPVIDTIYALDEIADAHRRMAAGAAMGKLVVVTGGVRVGLVSVGRLRLALNAVRHHARLDEPSASTRVVH